MLFRSGNGSIAYLVKLEDFAKHFGEVTQEALDEKDSDEIFSDVQRAVEGIVPLARLRIRKVVQDGIEFAVPEKRIYGKAVAGFRETIFEFLKEAQKENFNKLKAKGDANLANGFWFGGSYEDNSVNTLFKEMLDDYGIETEGSISHDDDMENSLLEIGRAHV